jgi:hypothetical protein
MEYHIIESSSIENLTAMVNNNWIPKGWKPLGGVAVIPRSSEIWRDRFLQTIIREEPPFVSRGDF